MTSRHTPYIYFFLPAVTAAVTSLVGCTNPPDSSVYQPDWDKELNRVEREAGAVKNDPPSVEQADAAAGISIDTSGDGPLVLSIEETTVLAMNNNRDLAVQQLTPVIVGTFERIERGVFDPEVFAEFEFREETTSQTDRATSQQFSVDSRENDTVAGIRQTLPSGTDVELSVEQGRDTSDRSPEQQDARLGLTVTQQLLRGTGPAVNLARVRQAELDTQASLYEFRGFAEALLAEVERTYWRYNLSMERIAIFEQSLELSRQQRDEVEQRIDVGALAESDAAVTRAEVAIREQALIDARSDLEAQRLRLLQLISPENTYARELKVSTRPQIDAEPINDLDDRVALADLRRPDLAEARLRLEQDRLETIVTRNGVLPRLEVFIALGKTGFDDTFRGSFRQLDDDTYDLVAGVRFSQLLRNQSAKARNEAAQTSRRQSAAAVENLRHLIELDLRLAANEVERARQQIQASRATRVLQEDTVQAERDRYDVGASTGLLVAQAQRDLLQAQINEVESVIAYRLALIDLYIAEGSLLDRRGFVVELTQGP